MRRLRWQVRLAALFLPLVFVPLTAPKRPMDQVLAKTSDTRPSSEPGTQVKNPHTLEEWQSVNPDIQWILHFEKEGRSLPVAATADDAYAMKHDPFGKTDSMGTLFTDRYGYQPDNLVIYGHSSRKRDEQFTFLKKYADAEYFQNHGEVILEDASGGHFYRIASFGLYDMQDENTYAMWASDWFDTDEEVERMFAETVPYLLQKRDGIFYHGQHVLTLVTCDMEKPDSRFVLQALEETP